MQTAVVDQFVDLTGRHAEVGRARRRRAEAGRAARRATSRPSWAGPSTRPSTSGEPGLCPLCHLDVVELQRPRRSQCATCGATGRLADDFTRRVDRPDTSVISMAEKRAHYDEILETAQRHAKLRDRSSRRPSTYDSFDPARPARIASLPTDAGGTATTNDVSQRPRPLHVLIAGGGLSGLALAQGLLKSGHTVEVFERDADLNRKQGYYLHFNAHRRQGAAPRACRTTSSSSTSRPRASPTTAPSRSCSTTSSTSSPRSPHMGPPNAGPAQPHRRAPPDAAPDPVRPPRRPPARRATRSSRYERGRRRRHRHASPTAAPRAATCSSAPTASARRSARQLLPEVPVIPTGIQGIGVYGRTPITPELDALLPDILNQGVLMAVDRKGSRLLIASFRPRRPADEAAADDRARRRARRRAGRTSWSAAASRRAPRSRRRAEWTAGDGAGDARLDARARSRAGTRRPGRSSRGMDLGLDVHDPVRLPRAGRELGAVAGHDRRRRRARHAARRSAWAPTCRSTTRPCSSTSSTGSAAARSTCPRRSAPTRRRCARSPTRSCG